MPPRRKPRRPVQYATRDAAYAAAMAGLIDHAELELQLARLSNEPITRNYRTDEGAHVPVPQARVSSLPTRCNTGLPSSREQSRIDELARRRRARDKQADAAAAARIMQQQ